MCLPILFVLFCLTACSVVFLLLSSNWMEVEGNPHAKRLFVDLLVNSSYNKLIRPVANVKDTLTVKLGLRLSQLIGIVSPVIHHLWQWLTLWVTWSDMGGLLLFPDCKLNSKSQFWGENLPFIAKFQDNLVDYNTFGARIYCVLGLRLLHFQNHVGVECLAFLDKVLLCCHL